MVLNVQILKMSMIWSFCLIDIHQNHISSFKIIQDQWRLLKIDKDIPRSSEPDQGRKEWGSLILDVLFLWGIFHYTVWMTILAQPMELDWRFQHGCWSMHWHAPLGQDPGVTTRWHQGAWNRPAGRSPRRWTGRSNTSASPGKKSFSRNNIVQMSCFWTDLPFHRTSPAWMSVTWKAHRTLRKG